MAHHHHYHHHHHHHCFSPDELLVAEALLDLRYGSGDRTPPLFVSWGRKRRRSVLQDPPPNWAPAPPLLITALVGDQPKTSSPKDQDKSPSPTTPFCFTPCDTDSDKFTNKINDGGQGSARKTKRPKHHNKRKEELEAQIAELSKQREDLRQAFKKVSILYEVELRQQSVLKQFLSTQQQSMSKTEDPIIVKTEGEEPIRAVRSPDHETQSEPSTSDQTVTVYAEELVVKQSPKRSQSQSQTYPNGIPDLNLSVVAEEFRALEGFLDVITSKAVCAEARKRRYEIKREKRLVAALAKQQR